MSDSTINFSQLAGAIGAPFTMLSVEIAEITGKSHRNVVRDLRKLEEQGVIELPRFEHLQEINTVDGHPTGTRTVYHLPKRETLILTSGYSAVQRAAIIDRWLALETQVAGPARPASPVTGATTKTIDLARYAELLEAENAQLRERARATACRAAPIPNEGQPLTAAEIEEIVAATAGGRGPLAFGVALARVLERTPT
ncbi:Rha family transcriptional regulator [uncultured Lamprocystis sp.]|jgi:phage regulator Rha-like protein|uniref:Rha family transcriptional regulator n=1 Tax=uncultured Lamprocystis sp. TaxID=543132 RepID=UPI0025ECDE20|nr:Rha family transcriptional regulator [uncultured Lamprocystis sp.]